MKIIALITAIVLAATMTVTAALKPPAVEVEPPAPMAETVEPRQSIPAPITEEEIIEEPVPEEIVEPTPVPEKEIVPAPAPELTTAPEPIVDHAKTSPTLKIGRRVVVSKEAFIQWIKENSEKS